MIHKMLKESNSKEMYNGNYLKFAYHDETVVLVDYIVHCIELAVKTHRWEQPPNVSNCLRF